MAGNGIYVTVLVVVRRTAVELVALAVKDTEVPIRTVGWAFRRAGHRFLTALIHEDALTIRAYT